MILKSDPFKHLVLFQNEKVITIGVNRDHANNFLYRTTFIGKILNWLTIGSPLLIIYVLIKYGIILGVFAFIFCGLYAVTVQKIATMYVRIRLLAEEGLFDAAYIYGSINIRVNSNNEIIHYPVVWREAIDKVYTEKQANR